MVNLFADVVNDVAIDNLTADQMDEVLAILNKIED